MSPRGNPSQVADFTPVPDGTYDLLILDVDVGEVKEGSENAGQPLWNFEFEILGPTKKGRKVWESVTDIPKAFWRFVQIWKAVGYPTPDKDIEMTPKHFIGKRLVAEVYTEPAKGRYKAKNRVSEFVSAEQAQAVLAGAGTSAEPADEVSDLPF